jgi:hypothetical protein
MEKIDFNGYKVPKNQSNLKGRWHEFAIDVCREFNVIPPYDQIIFKLAKNNLSFLEHKVAYVKDSPKYGKLKSDGALGKYLIRILYPKNRSRV